MIVATRHTSTNHGPLGFGAAPMWMSFNVGDVIPAGATGSTKTITLLGGTSRYMRLRGGTSAAVTLKGGTSRRGRLEG